MTLPVLWHIPPSHYNEKVRWALEFKGIEHERRAPPPPTSIAAALWLTRAPTLPVLQLDGRAIGDSTAIIAALEGRGPSLFPVDPGERARALELEDFFDEELGPYTRGLAFHALLDDRPALTRFASSMLPGPLARSDAVRAGVGAGTDAFLRLRYRPGSDAFEARAQAKVAEGLDRLEAELDGRAYLAGGTFSVADLTAACMLAPLLLAPEGPELPDPPAPFMAYRDTLRERPGFLWALGIFREHRGVARRP